MAPYYGGDDKAWKRKLKRARLTMSTVSCWNWADSQVLLSHNGAMFVWLIIGGFLWFNLYKSINYVDIGVGWLPPAPGAFTSRPIPMFEEEERLPFTTSVCVLKLIYHLPCLPEAMIFLTSPKTSSFVIPALPDYSGIPIIFYGLLLLFSLAWGFGHIVFSLFLNLRCSYLPVKVPKSAIKIALWQLKWPRRRLF